jgi:NAD(P)H-hydrate epimerase
MGMRLVKASEMKEMDRRTIQEMGIAGIVLMENAARGATRRFLDHFTPGKGARVLILCGRGNNGGDGYVMARYLRGSGLEVTVLVLSSWGKISGDALTNLEIIKKMGGLRVLEVPDEAQWETRRREMESHDYIIDGILGTGINAPVEGFYREGIEAANDSGKRIMAIDIPSGLNADNGQVMGVAVRADLTVTFGFPKLGHIIYP